MEQTQEASEPSAASFPPPPPLLDDIQADLLRAIGANLQTFHYEGLSIHDQVDNASSNSSSSSATPGSPALAFRYDPSLLAALVLNDILTSGSRYGSFSSLHTDVPAFPSLQSRTSPEKIAFEFSSPNIAKPFHVGHLRSTILGNCLSKINSFLGRDVTRFNYLGDWGTQFGLMAVGIATFGDERLKRELEVEATSALSSDSCSSSSSESPSSTSSLAKLLDIYVKVNEAAEKDEEIRWVFDQ